jgi:hypothetical protein
VRYNVQDEEGDWAEYIVLNRRRIKKSRIEHRCCYCAQNIPAGSSCYSESALYDGTVSTIYRHASHGGNFNGA